MPDAAELDRLAGLVERVTFHNEQNGFCVLRLKVKGERELITLIGHAPVVSPGEYASASGNWVTDREHGRQFRAVFVKIYPPTTLTGIERYLGSGMVKGIGPVYAGKLVKAFGAAVFDVIEQSPERLREIPGIGEVRARKITSGWADQKVIRSIMVFLHAHGVSTSRAVRIFKTYGQGAIEIVQENPYRLAQDIRGIGFLSADTIAQKIGIAKDSPLRAQAGISYALTEASGQGHCGLPYAELVPLAVKLLDIAESIIETAIAQEVADEVLLPDTVEGQACVFLAPLYYAEQSIAAQIQRLDAGGTTLPAFEADKAIPWVEQKLSIQLADSQKAGHPPRPVFQAAGDHRRTRRRQDHPGEVDSDHHDRQGRQTPAVCADGKGGQASVRIDRSGSQDDPSLAGDQSDQWPVQAQRGQSSRMRSSGGRRMFDDRRAVGKPVAQGRGDRTAVILVGDVDQLPSVGPGQFLTDLIDSGVVPVIRLTEVFRQAATSRIVRSAHQINRGVFPSLPEKGEASDFYLVAAEEPEVIAQTVVDLVQTRLPRKFEVDPIRDIQVLCPMNRGITGARGINQALQAVLNPPGEHSVEKFGNRFSVGDKVMQIENNYDRDVFNGDIGFVTGVDQDEEELAVAFDGRVVSYPFGELDELVLCYATTIHKSQGSEYPVVVIPISTQHYMMLKRNLIYTGITRGKRLVVLVGQKRALAMAVKGKQVERRWSKLKERLVATKR
jgi:exodeoxyribonuclease V alpha subunit